MNKLLNMLGLAKKAGKLIQGFDPTCESILKRKALFIITTGDLSPKTEKELDYILKGSVAVVCKSTLTLDEIHRATAKRSGILCIEDKGFAEKISSLCKPYTQADPPKEGLVR